MDDFTATRAALRSAVDSGTCSGAQVRILRGGKELAHLVIGDLTENAAVPWFSASKLPASLAVAKAWELGLLDPDDRVADHLPELANPDIRIRHLLTHTAPLRTVDRSIGGAIDTGRDAQVDRVLRAETDPDWVPGERAAYLGHAGYLLLDEIVARRSGTSFAAFQDKHIMAPLGLTSTLGGPPGTQIVEVPWLGPPELAARVGRFDVSLGYASACVAGPFGEAADLCELLRTGGNGILTPETCATMTTDQRPPDLVDEAARRPRRWGLGVPLAEPNFGPSPASFGALGGTACLVFSDRELTVALYFVGNVGPRERVARDIATTSAIHSDLLEISAM